MPLTLTCDEVEPGMRLAEAVVYNGLIMLPGGKTLRSSDVRALRRRFPWITIRVGDSALDDAVDFQDDSHDRKVAQTVQSRITGCLADVQGQRREGAGARKLEIDLTRAKQAVAEIVDYLRSNPVSSALLSKCFEADSRFAVHSGNVFYLSMLLASALRDYVARERKRQTAAELHPKQLYDLTPLGLGAMFADIGMVPLTSLYQIKRPLRTQEREKVRDHPIVGAESLPEQFPAVARSAVKNHHENHDGTGYPRQLNGEGLHIFTRILRIADAYDAATASDTFEKARSPIRALWEISVGPYRQFYDPVLSEMLPKLVQPFPVGAKLRLVDGRYAVVVQHNYDSPFDPTVVVAFDSRNERLPDFDPPAPVEESKLLIKSYAGEDLTYLQFSDCQPATPSSRFRTLFEASYP